MATSGTLKYIFGPLGRLEHRELAKCAASCGLSMLSGTEEEEGTGELFNVDVWPGFQNAPLLRTALLLLSQKLSKVSLSLGSH